MPKILITGISGFVGGHFVEFLHQQRSDFTIHGVSRSKPNWPFVTDRERLIAGIKFHQLDLLDVKATTALLREIEPDCIVHLASFSSVGESWKQPTVCFLNNTNIFLNILEAVRLDELGCRVLSVGSSEQYGVVDEKHLPLRETHPTNPVSPYAVARVAQEHLGLLYAKAFAIDICCTRSFNHVGPGQTERFVISSIVKQFAEIKKGRRPPVVTIGDGRIVRDFVSVHDVVTAYDQLLVKGRVGEVYNICSGKGHSILDVVNLVSSVCGISVDVQTANQLVRPADNPTIIGCNDKIRNDVGWQPRVGLETALQEMFEYWSRQLA